MELLKIRNEKEMKRKRMDKNSIFAVLQYITEYIFHIFQIPILLWRDEYLFYRLLIVETEDKYKNTSCLEFLVSKQKSFLFFSKPYLKWRYKTPYLIKTFLFNKLYSAPQTIYFIISIMGAFLIN